MPSTVSKLYKIFRTEIIARLTLVAILFWVPVVLFTLIADEVSDRDPLFFDDSILHWLNELSSPDLDQAVLFLTHFGDVEFVVPVVLILAIALVILNRIKDVRILLFGVGGAAVMNLILKSIFRRDRPQLWETLVTEQTFSFPSGHAMASSALACCIVVICWKTRWRWPVLILAVIYTIAIGLTRNYLGVHYPSDVIAGWCLSVAWVILVAYTVDPSNRSHAWLKMLPGFKR